MKRKCDICKYTAERALSKGATPTNGIAANSKEFVEKDAEVYTKA